MKTLLTLTLLLISLNTFSKPPEHANNPEPEDMPEEAECSFCDPDSPLENQHYLLISGVIYARIYLAYKKQPIKK